MASTLLGVDYVVQWSDFTVRTAPPAGQEGFDLRVSTGTFKSGGNPVSMSSVGSFFTVQNDLLLRVHTNPDSWRLAHLSYIPGKNQVWLIKHEQVHYDFQALLTRDFYWRVRSMMGTPYSSKAQIASEIQMHHSATMANIQPLNERYDVHTSNSQNGERQWQSWSAIERARQLHRTPLEKNADGGLLKIELMTALKTAGLIP